MKTLLVLAVVAVVALCKEDPSPFKTQKDAKIESEQELAKLSKRVAELEVQSKQSGRGSSTRLMLYMRQLSQRTTKLEQYYNKLAVYSKNTDKKFEKAKKDITNILKKYNEQMEEVGEQSEKLSEMVEKKAKEFGLYLQEHGKYLKKAFAWLGSIQKQLANKVDKKDEKEEEEEEDETTLEDLAEDSKEESWAPRHHDHHQHKQHHQHHSHQHREEEPEELIQKINTTKTVHPEPEEEEENTPKATETKKQSSWGSRLRDKWANKSQAAKTWAVKQWKKHKDSPWVKRMMNAKQQENTKKEPKPKVVVDPVPTTEEPEMEEEVNEPEVEEVMTDEPYEKTEEIITLD